MKNSGTGTWKNGGGRSVTGFGKILPLGQKN